MNGFKEIIKFLREFLIDFLTGVAFIIYMVKRIDNALFRFSVFCILPYYLLYEDFVVFIRVSLVEFIYKRSLYILSNHRYARHYWVNFCLSFFEKDEFLDVEALLAKDNKLLYWIKEFYWSITHIPTVYREYKKEQAKKPLWENIFYLAVIKVIKLCLFPLVLHYAWMVIPDRNIRNSLFRKSFYSFITFANPERYEFKDDDMHPTFKTKWPFMIWWLRDLSVEFQEYELAWEEEQDSWIVLYTAYYRGLRRWVLAFADKYGVYIYKLLDFFSYLIFGLFLIIYNLIMLPPRLVSIIGALLYICANSVSYAIIGFFFSYYYILASLLRRFAPNPLLLFSLYFLNFMFGFLLFLEFLYWTGPFVARLILYFYSPAGLFTVYLVVTLLLPLYILQLLFPLQWEETWEELWAPLLMLILTLPSIYTILMADHDWDQVFWDSDDDTVAIIHFDITRKLFTEAYVAILKYFYAEDEPLEEGMDD